MSNHAAPVLALDIGGTKLAVGLVDADGVVHGLTVEKTRPEEGSAVVIERLFEMADRTLIASGYEGPIGAVGIACGGPLDAAGGVLQEPLHLPGWVNVPIVSMAKKRFRVPAVLANDATAGAWGEYRFGAGRGTNSLLYITVSTGMGGGAVFDGRLHAGAAGNGGEFGHIMVRPGGRLCTCGRRGCVEAYVAGSSLAALAREQIADGRASVLSAVPTITGADITAVVGTDELASEIWNDATSLLGIAVTDLVNILEPDIVVLGGGVTRAGAMLLDPVRAIVNEQAMRPAAAAVKVVLAELGDEVCVVGAGAVALDLVAAMNIGIRMPANVTEEQTYA